MGALFAASKGELRAAALSVAEGRFPKIGVMTGFYIPSGNPPACETDGPLGAALLIAGLCGAGVPCRLVTDAPCLGACEAALRGAGVSVPVDVAGPDSLEAITKTWIAEGITHALSIERCGRSADGTPRNMRGEDIGMHTVALDKVFLGGPWAKLAIGDGGNEIGMGCLEKRLIAENVRCGETIACAVPADHLIVAGVSNWAAYALTAALAVLREEWKAPLMAALTRENNERILRAMVYDGPAVDGVTGMQALSVDGMPVEKHNKILEAIREIAERPFL